MDRGSKGLVFITKNDDDMIIMSIEIYKRKMVLSKVYKKLSEAA